MATMVELAEAVAKVRGETKPSAAPTKGVVDQMREMETKLTESIDYFKDTLLPWAMERLQKGESADPKLHSQEGAGHFGLMVKSLMPDEFATLIREGSPLGEAERKAFVAMADAMKVVPASTSTPAEASAAPTKGTVVGMKEKR